jgi:hypothetical protein
LDVDNYSETEPLITEVWTTQLLEK